MTSTTEINRAAAIRFIEAFNNDEWETVGEVVSPGFVLHHPVGGTNRLGPEGMVAVWSHFKAALPDSWHPIPVMITEGDYLANLLPTYGHFTGEPHQGVPPTGEWLEYGMVNLVRLEDGKLVEAWFGMDPLAEMQQMGAAPSPPPRQLSDLERANVELFRSALDHTGLGYDNVTAFGDVVVAIGPPQYGEDTKVRTVEIYRVEDEVPSLVATREFPTIPPYAGSLSADTEASRALVSQFIDEVRVGHDVDALARLLSPHVLIHPTAMPCEAGYYGIDGASSWLHEAWQAFPDLAVVDHFAIAHGDIVAVRWTARGTSKGEFMHVPPTGKEVEFTGVSMYQVEDGKITEIWETRNTLGIMTQLNPDIAAGHHHH